MKNLCNGEKAHEFLLRIDHGELLQENQCIFDIEGVDISGIYFSRICFKMNDWRITRIILYTKQYTNAIFICSH